VDTKGNSGNNVNLDEIIAIKEDIQNLIANGFKGTIGIITSFREQKYRMEEILRKELRNYYQLSKKHKLVIWFVGDVQGEERDIVYYSLVEDKTISNADLRTIYPVIEGRADSIRSLKMQRLNVGFSRAKDTIVIVHSMVLEEYSNTRMGDALKFYRELQENAVDNYIADETIFGSPAEKDLYNLLIQTDFYKTNRNKIKIIAQFPIGEYIQKTYNKYIPKYRVDFLIIFSHHGKEKSLILEYDGVEYHTKNPNLITKHNFSQEYLEYDIQRQLELESYGYSFLRINKFILLPQEKNQTKLDILNILLVKKLSFKEN
jgi:very-short-patch-repair endonuclease